MLEPIIYKFQLIKYVYASKIFLYGATILYFLQNVLLNQFRSTMPKPSFKNKFFDFLLSNTYCVHGRPQKNLQGSAR